MNSLVKLHDRVRLTHALPTLWLQRGEVGVVESIWSDTPGFCEVEFHKQGESFSIRALIQAEHLEVIESAHANITNN